MIELSPEDKLSTGSRSIVERSISVCAVGSLSTRSSEASTVMVWSEVATCNATATVTGIAELTCTCLLKL